ncbi:ornithine cyclodeaminase family protein [Gephyromycinifex aptenodytis]|uniref:ornithine cyclodeaminase family protein n=1 Tax=Gephyromycinifex aptenodytis TaxID=2716227 RepID=UPI001444DB71|nr:ornithine cyclodeaminase family protein [Gephyromycinifex aptenodytis]
MTDHQLLVLNRADLESLSWTWDEVIDVLEAAYLEKSRGLVQNPPKPKVAPREGIAFAHAMPAYLGGSDQLGVKWVAGYSQNHTRGLPFLHGVMLLCDAETGRPTALLDGGWITEIRTPGVSGVTLRHTPAEPARVVFIGCGLQALRHLEVALERFPGIEEVVAYSTREEAARRLLERAGDRRTRIEHDATRATEGADLVITTVTRDMEPRLDCANVASEAVLLPVDYDHALSAAAVSASDFYCVDDLQQYGSVAGTDYFFGYPTPDTDLAAVVAGQHEIPSAGRRTILNMGIAMNDVALAGLVLQRAQQAGVGTPIDWQ